MFIIPMAGKSSRFYKAGYSRPKYMLKLGRKSYVFDEAVKSFEKYFKKDLFLFIVRKNNETIDFVNSRCKDLGIDEYHIVAIDFDTKGQAETINIGINTILNKINLSEELYIFNIDSIRLNFIKPDDSFTEGIAGYLEVFNGEGSHWSFVDPIDKIKVKRTTEKIRISNLCSNGLYYFKSINYYQTAYNEMLNLNEYNELYVAPMYNFLLKKNHDIYYKLIDKSQVLFSGIPSEYEILNEAYQKKDD